MGEECWETKIPINKYGQWREEDNHRAEFLSQGSSEFSWMNGGFGILEKKQALD